MNFLFTCGGTAGHINPALAVAGILRDRMPDCGILFVGANGKMETDLVPRAGYDIVTIEVTNIHRSLKPSEIAYNFRSLHNARQATKDARKIIEDFQPDVAIGTGGYVCYPVLKAAAQLGIPTVVHESNAVPGLTTKMLAGAVDRILVGFEESKQHYSEQEKVVVTGTPVRGAFTACSKAEAKRQLGLDPDRPLVVSVWGSLGASYMNEVMTAFITRAAVTDAPFALIHSAGRNGYEKMHAALLEKCPADLAAHGMDVRPYIYDMPGSSWTRPISCSAARARPRSRSSRASASPRSSSRRRTSRTTIRSATRACSSTPAGRRCCSRARSRQTICITSSATCSPTPRSLRRWRRT